MVEYKIERNLPNNWLTIIDGDTKAKEQIAQLLSRYRTEIDKHNFTRLIQELNKKYVTQIIGLVTALLVSLDAYAVSSALTSLTTENYYLISRMLLNELTIDEDTNIELWVVSSEIKHLTINLYNDKQMKHFLDELNTCEIKLLSIKSANNKSYCIKTVNKYKNIKDVEFI